jgi:hypothetical protein
LVGYRERGHGRGQQYPSGQILHAFGRGRTMRSPAGEEEEALQQGQFLARVGTIGLFVSPRRRASRRQGVHTRWVVPTRTRTR